MKIWKYEKFINTSLSRDRAHFNLLLFHRNKTTESSPSYCWIFVFKGIPFPAVLLSFLVCWKNLG